MSMPATTLMPGRLLPELLPGIPGVPAIPVRGLATDSRRVDDGFLFLAVPGATSHGMAFARAAADRGAVAIAADPDGLAGVAHGLTIPVIAVPGLGGMLGDIANRFWDTPSAAIDVYGITGTNGKTTVAWLLAGVLERLGQPAGYVGTIGSGLGRVAVQPGLTTPGVIELHGRLAEFRDAGARAAAIEVPSHALVQTVFDSDRRCSRTWAAITSITTAACLRTSRPRQNCSSTVHRNPPSSTLIPSGVGPLRRDAVAMSSPYRPGRTSVSMAGCSCG